MMATSRANAALSDSSPARVYGLAGGMNRIRCCVCLCELFLLFSVLALTCARGQNPGGLGGILGPDSLNTTSIAVEVRGADGVKLSSMALVNLSNSFGQLVRSQTTFGSQTVFQIGAGAYTVEIEAFGYRKARVQAEVSSANPHRVVVVTLQPESGETAYAAGAGLALSSKAQKEASKGAEALQRNKFDEAVKHFEAAHRLAPNHPDVLYMLGLVYEKRNDLASARKYWDLALEAEPKHISSLLACGNALLHQEDIAGARNYLDRAAEVAPNSWRVHGLLGTVLLRQGLYADAVTHSERAIELGKGQAGSAMLILGQALAAEHQNEQAIAALNNYLATKPPAQNAEAVEKLIAQLKNAQQVSDAATVGGVSYESGSFGKDIPGLPLSPAALHWIPANVDDVTPSVEPGISCSVADVLKKASTRVSDLPQLVDRYAATEMLRHEELNNAGYPEHVEDLSFNYLASIREIKSKFGEFLDVQEYRNGSTGNDMFPDQMASTGLPSVVLIFHPWLISDFDMDCEGLSRVKTGFAWQVHFSQKLDKESRIRQYRVSGHVYPVALKGRAWIDADSFQVVRLETDLRETRPDLRLATEHLVMEYRPIHFKSREDVLWLPSSAEYYAMLRGHRFHRRHSFTDYVLFSIEDKQKLGKPAKDPDAN